MVGPGAEPGLVPRNHCKLPLPGFLLGSHPSMLSCIVTGRVLEVFSPFILIKPSHPLHLPFYCSMLSSFHFHPPNPFPTFHPKFQTGSIKELLFFNVEKLSVYNVGSDQNGKVEAVFFPFLTAKTLSFHPNIRVIFIPHEICTLWEQSADREKGLHHY